jgi:hypothetical protein
VLCKFMMMLSLVRLLLLVALAVACSAAYKSESCTIICSDWCITLQHADFSYSATRKARPCCQHKTKKTAVAAFFLKELFRG